MGLTGHGLAGKAWSAEALRGWAGMAQLVVARPGTVRQARQGDASLGLTG